MSESIRNVLILCTGNSARSILAEAIFNRAGAGRLRAWSGGSHPTGRVNPFALELLLSKGFDISGCRSKNWDEFAVPDAPIMDVIVTVCDNAAGETCPIWPGQPISVHWGIEDPAAVEGSDQDKRRAFMHAFDFLQRRISMFLALPLDRLDPTVLKEKLDSIGREK